MDVCTRLRTTKVVAMTKHIYKTSDKERLQDIILKSTNEFLRKTTRINAEVSGQA